MTTRQHGPATRVTRRAVAALLAGAVAAATVGTAPAAAARPDAEAVPAVIQPPAGAQRVATYRVVFGVQIYQCQAGAWVLRAPEALLVERTDRTDVIRHFGGPSWQSLVDGSLVTAARRADSPVPGAIPQLLLEVTSHSGATDGLLAEVDFIQRLRTRGGLAPVGACADGDADRPVRYGADYVLFAMP